ncbi:hypothetical protein M9H77_18798 [Catharanthus roseus]|uniref:Uncharacterized protein n=1 Tax=Catharanthus roseus TaxID=4058 RepID=A0ACC0B8F9_CATRO|nr:hypothetical protein M9H77_18798 [Catharanthus roseus]
MERTPFGEKWMKFHYQASHFPYRTRTSFSVVNIAPRNNRNAIKLYRIIGKYIPNSPSNQRDSYVNYRDFDLGINHQKEYTSVKQARVWGAHYFKSNFEQSIPPYR